MKKEKSLTALKQTKVTLVKLPFESKGLLLKSLHSQLHAHHTFDFKSLERNISGRLAQCIDFG